MQELLVDLSFNINKLGFSFMLSSLSIHETSFFNSFDLNFDVSSFDGSSDSQINTSCNLLARIVDRLSCLKHNVAIFVMASRVNVSHMICVLYIYLI